MTKTILWFVVGGAMGGFVGAQSPVPFAWSDLAIPNTSPALTGLADVDGDGAPDLIVSTSPPSVLRNDGHGWFSGPASPAGSAAAAPPSAIADFNGDGFADVAILGSNSVTLWFGAPPGVLVSTAPIAVPGAASIAAGQVDGDPTPDLVVGTLFPNPPGQPSGFSAGATVVLLNDGIGGFSTAGALGLPPLGNAGFLLMDVDHDGDQDLAVTSFGIAGATAGTVFNSGGLFGNAVNVTPGSGGAPTVPRVARLSNDLFPDLIACPPSGPIMMFLGGPTGFTPFGPPSSFTATAVSAATDLNLDGIDEVITPGVATTIVWSVGAGGGLTAVQYLPRYPGDVLARDLDADGDPDLVIHETRSGLNSQYLTDASGVLHEQGPAVPPLRLLGGPVPIDVDGDGAPELAGITPEGGVTKLAIATNDGVGRFAWSTLTPAGPVLGGNQVLLAALDFDGDGDQDLVTIELTAPPIGLQWIVSLRSLANQGGGAWTASAPTTLSPGAANCDAAVGDLNGDGIQDLVYCDQLGVRIVQGSPSGLVLPGTVITSFGGRRLALGDLDLDGDLDIAVVNSGSYLLFNQGGGSFAPVTAFIVNLTNYVSLADVNGDGFLDIYVDSKLYLHSGTTWVFYADVPTGFPYNGIGGGAHMRSFDFDGDGDVDTVTGAGFAHVNEGIGVTTHALPVSAPTVQYLTPVDLDRDGDLDVIFQTPTPTPIGPTGTQDRVFSVLFNTARQLSLEAAARPGHTAHLGLSGAPNGSWLLFASTGLGALPLPPYGTVLIDPAQAIQIGAGVLDAGGRGDLAVPLPASFSTYLGVEFDAQGVVDTAAGPRLTNARRIVISAY